MDNVLALLPIIEVDRTIVSRNELLNMSRVTTWWRNSDGYVEFYFQDIADRKDKATEYKTSLDLHTFETYFEETQPNPFITINCDQFNPHPIGIISPGDLQPFPFPHQRVSINLDWFVKARARPSDETGSYIWVSTKGAFNYIVFQTGNTLEEINTSSSNSGSMP